MRFELHNLPSEVFVAFFEGRNFEFLLVNGENGFLVKLLYL